MTQTEFDAVTLDNCLVGQSKCNYLLIKKTFIDIISTCMLKGYIFHFPMLALNQLDSTDLVYIYVVGSIYLVFLYQYYFIDD